MTRLLRQPLARRIATTAGLGALADWVAFAALVALVARLTGGSVFAVAIVTATRIVPSVAMGPLLAPYAARVGLRRTLLFGDLLRAGAIVFLGTSSSVGGLVVGLLLVEFCAAMLTAARESAISTGIPAEDFHSMNTATGVLSYGMLPVGGFVAAALLQIASVAPFLAAALLYTVTATVMGSAPLGGQQSQRAEKVSPLVGLRKVARAGALRDAVIAATVGVVAITMLFSTGTRMAEQILGSQDAHGVLLGLLGIGALVGAVAAQRRVRASAGLVTATGGSLLLLGSAWIPVVGLLVIGCGAAITYVATQAALQHAGHGPEDFAAAFAVIKVGTLLALICAPALYRVGGPAGVTAAMAGLTAAGALFVTRRLESADPLRRPLVAAAVLAVARRVLRWACRIEITGNLPKGGAVVVANHPNALDGPLGVLLDTRVRPVAKPQRHPLARLGFLLTGALITGRGTTAPAVDYLRAGGYVWLAPEGRICGPVLGRARTGAARMAAAAQVPIVPMAIRYATPGGPKLRDWRPWRRPVAFVELGAAIPVEVGADPRMVSDHFMGILAEMLGQPYDPTGMGDLAVAA